MGLLDDAVRRHRERQDPIGRLPWGVRLVGVLVLAAIAVAQVTLGRGLSVVLGLALLLLVVPAQALATWAAWKVSREG